MIARFGKALIALAIAASPLVIAGRALATNFAVLLGSPERSDADKARDADRKPAQLMAFAGIKPGTQVAELAPGGGYYTRLLSLAVGDKGHVFAVSNRESQAVRDWAKTHGNVSLQIGIADGKLAPIPVDVVWTTLNYHDFKNVKVGERDAAAAFNEAAFASLKPGGIYLINDHEAAPGTGTSATNSLHRIESSVVIREVEAAGFKLIGKSDILRHPADDHTIRVVETGIRGKTDQFVLRFQKPRGKR
jgi:predicted methyltransferase